MLWRVRCQAGEASASLQMIFVLFYLRMPYLRVLICRCEQNGRLRRFDSRCLLEYFADEISDLLRIILLSHNCSPSSLLAATPREDLSSSVGISSKTKEFFSEVLKLERMAP